jgi:hypothetical protein
LVEEDPYVGAPTGLGYFERGRNVPGAGGFQVRQCIQHGGVFVEVGSDPPAGVVVGQRVQADVVFAAQMLCDDVLGQWQVRRLRRGHALAPVTADRGNPSGPAVAVVFPADGVGIGPAPE